MTDLEPVEITGYKHKDNYTLEVATYGLPGLTAHSFGDIVQ